MEARPAKGWFVTRANAWKVDGERRYAFEVGNGWRSSTLELYLAEPVLRRWLQADDGRSADELAEHYLRDQLRRAKWADIEIKTGTPTEVLRADALPPRPRR